MSGIVLNVLIRMYHSGTAHTSAIRIITTLVTAEPILLRVVKFMPFGAVVTEEALLPMIYSNLLEIRLEMPI